MKMNKYYALAAFASLVLASCNNDDNVAVELPQGQEIRFGAQTITADTRAPFDGTISSTNKLTAHIIGSETTSNYATIYTDNAGAEAKGDITFEDNGTTEYGFPSGVKWKDGTTTLYFRGFYPAGSVWTIAAGASAMAAIDGKTDLMLAPEVSGQQADGALNFAFSHLLTKLHVKVVGNATTAADWGDITKIELDKALNASPKNSVSQTFSDPSATYTGSATAIPFFQATEADSKITYTDDALTGKAVSVPATPELVAYALVAPVDAVDGSGDVKDEYTLKVYTSSKATDGKPVAINLKAMDGTDYAGSTAGKKFDITIQFRGEGQITATATVTEWEDGGSGNGTM